MTPYHVSPIKLRHLRKLQKGMFSIGLIALLATLFPFGSIRTANAAVVTSFSGTFSNVTAATPSNATFVFTTPTGIALNATVTLTFPSGFTVSTIVAADVTLKDGASTLTVAASPTTTSYGWACVALVCTLTAPSSSNNIAAGHVVTIQTANNHITNPSAASYKIALAGSFGDTGTIAEVFLASTNSPVTIDATIDPAVIFTWTGGNTLHFGTLTANNSYWATTGAGPVTAETVSGLSFTLGTNAATGVAVTVNGASLAGPQTISPISGGPTALSIGTEQFGLRLTRSGSGTTSIASQYAGTAGNYGFTAGSASTLASSSVPSLTDTYTLYVAANISAITKPGAYSTTLTFVATGTF